MTTELNGTWYSLPGNPSDLTPAGKQARRNMQVVSLIEELINLQKSGTDRPTTQPVQLIP